MKAEAELREEIEARKLAAFPRAIASKDFEAAVPVLLQSYGLGPVRAALRRLVSSRYVTAVPEKERRLRICLLERVELG